MSFFRVYKLAPYKAQIALAPGKHRIRPILYYSLSTPPPQKKKKKEKKRRSFQINETDVAVFVCVCEIKQL